jgi:hypothetical protein
MPRFRRLAPALALVLVLTGCTDDFAPVAVAAIGGVPTVVWKFCDTDRGVGSVTVSRVTDAEPEQWPVVWRARLDAGATPLRRVPVATQVSGYTVLTQDAWPLRTDVTYAVTDATDVDRVNVLASSLEFRHSVLLSGEVVADPETDRDLDRWLGTDGPECA